MQTIWGIVKVDEECNAGRIKTIMKMWLFFGEERKVKAVSLSASPISKWNRVAKLCNALETKEQELQTLTGLAAESATFLTEVTRLRNFVERLGRERRKR